MNAQRMPTHPGAVLREDILPAMGLSVTELARRLHMSRQSLHRILAEEQPVTAATALKLARLMDTSAELWLNMQRNRDLWEQRRKLAAELESIEPVAA
ncbi:HigA family addiction module antitoxin [Wenzhouxiangella limi]|uniref:HigA family addiction module antidote protein n=1 Tax=Wenzhouxiangella limi TaxID=2707351 RepID=A0A845UZU8_9GAMM|nr:HigA family addiction module antitoxin [Wenzhouxiangella limi]NDY95460.1 HigA family addiction module antidote protein [Wenzhouxiangella limi]